MSQQLAQQYMDALHALEEREDLETLVSQYAPDAEIWNVNLPQPLKGEEGVRKFWTDYRSLFSEIYSEFFNTVVEGEKVALEWVGRGKFAASGESFEYAGVSMLTFRDGKVASHRGYYDQQALTERVRV
ncbi:MAG: nuclear transport factor 2 family protein [Chloroflexota bacterium]|nr:nuclear transport factor 2 family protein [Chloroflexota bacterium]